MNFLFINGSPEAEDGCTYRAFNEISNVFESKGHTVTFKNIHNFKDCTNCRACKKGGKCRLSDANELYSIIDEIKKADGVIFGSPVYYGGITGSMKSFITRLLYSTPNCLKFKPISCVVSSRRAGSLQALSEFYSPFLMHSAIIVGSQYWNEVHGDTPDEVELDYERLQCMRTLALNMIFVSENLRNKETPIHEKKKHINFISREYKELCREKL